MCTRLLIKLPVRSRPLALRDTLDRFYAYLSGEIEVGFVISLDNDDPTCNTSEMRRYLDGKANLRYVFGPSSTKVEAINADIPAVGWDILILAATDTIPEIKGYDKIISDLFPTPESLDTLLHLPDGNRDDDLVTIPVMGSRYFQRFGYIYHPSYKSLFCDDEQTIVAQQLGRYRSHNQILIRHRHHARHPDVVRDSLYDRNELPAAEDEANLATRRARGFPSAT